MAPAWSSSRTISGWLFRIARTIGVQPVDASISSASSTGLQRLLGWVTVSGRGRVLANVGLWVGMNRRSRRVRQEVGVSRPLRALAGSTGFDDEEDTEDQNNEDGCNQRPRER